HSLSTAPPSTTTPTPPLHDALPIYGTSNTADPEIFVSTSAAMLGFRPLVVWTGTAFLVAYWTSANGVPALVARHLDEHGAAQGPDRKSTRLNSSHLGISYAVFCLKK